ncbi:MAG: hypothetical protein E7157_02360 [Lactobacillales bacterium]|nr:hypothetical protein [Lactobacillales bacterium]
MKHVYTSIDIGTDTIKVAVCELFNNKLNLLAASSVKSEGIKKGLIVNPETAKEKIEQAINEVEEMLGINIKQVIVSVPSYSADFKLVNGKTSINEDVGVLGKDISRVLENSVKNADIGNNEVVNVLPIDFGLDEQKGILDPKGKTGKILTSRAVLGTVPKKNLYSVVSLLENIGLEVVDVSLNPVGDINIFKNKETENKVGAIINIGYDTTEVSIYNKGIIIKNSIINLGSMNIDSDISYIYKISNNDSSKIKEKFALAHKRYASKSDFYEITNKLGEKIKINQFEVSEVVMSRIEEILVLARKEINLLTKREVDYIIITGGTSSMDNFSVVCEEILGNSASIGNIRILGVRNNKYSAVIGNIINFINNLKLKNIDYTMIDEEEFEEYKQNKNNIMNVINDTMLGKVFGYFFND